MDYVIYEVNREGEVIWKWGISEHIDEMGFSKAEFEAMKRFSRGPPTLT